MSAQAESKEEETSNDVNEISEASEELAAVPQDPTSQAAESTTYLDIDIITPENVTISVPSVSITEPIGALKQLLSEFVETAFYSSFSLASKQENQDEYIKLFEFQEISSLVNPEQPQAKVTVYVLVEDYDVKQVRMHLRKFRDVLSNPPLAKGSKSSAKHSSKSESKSEEKAPMTLQEIIASIPDAEALVASLKLKDFYKEVLLRTGNPHVNDIMSDDHRSIISLTDVVKSVSLSPYNPPPANRRILGDLCYIEVVIAEEGVFQITATSTGFYVNNSTRTIFDPKVSTMHPYFAHELFPLLLQVSPSLKATWNTILQYVNKQSNKSLEDQPSGALDVIASLYQAGKGDQISNTPQWNCPPLSFEPINDKIVNVKKHTSDISRLQDDLMDNFGIDERGSSREWNDEIQPIRDMKPSNIQERVTKAKYCHKVVSEFTEASKSLANAIIDGHITPLNFGESEASLIYVYNGIFISRAVDTKDTFRVCVGEEACRKAAGLDLKNQKYLLSLGIDGMSTVLTVMIDVRGERFIAQSIIPGVLSSGLTATSARLVYGVLQPNKRICNKTTIQPQLEQMKKFLYLKEHQVPILAQSTLDLQSNADNNTDQQLPLVTGFLSQIEQDKNAAPIRVDDEDEMITDPAATMTPHVGPIEGKLLQGSDGRVYALDMLRLTPRDANYVQEAVGTGLIKSETLNDANEELFTTYVLRHELIYSYIQMKVNGARQQLLIDAVKAQQAQHKEKEKVEDGSAVATTSPEQSDVPSDFVLTEDIAAKYNAITSESFPIELNPNLYLSLYQPSHDEKDADQLTADKAIICELSSYLYSTVLPTITHQIRMLDTIVHDNQQLVEYLHSQGVNMRYLGQLASLARSQEVEDITVARDHKQRIHAMPTYWLELLEIEIIARAVKHLCRKYYLSSKKVHAAPAYTIISVLNHIFGVYNHQESVVTVDGNTTSQPQPSSLTISTPNQSLSKSAKKRMKAKASSQKSSTTPSKFVVEPVDATTNQPSTLEELQHIIKQRFLYDLILAQVPKPSSDSSSTSTPGQTFLSSRINRYTFLRRICQLNGFRLISKDYDFQTSSHPFIIDDLASIQPIIKSCDPDIPIMELRNLIIHSRSAMQESNLQLAFELCNEASHWIQQVVGPIHRETLLAVDQLTAIFITANDMISALSTSLRGLNLAIQIYGLDSHETYQHHLQLVNIYMELKHYELAIQHLLTCKYLIVLIGGDHHPEISTIYSLLATIANECGDYDIACKCYLLARVRVTDLNKHSTITENLAEVYLKLGKLDEALLEQRTSYNVIDGIFGKANPKTNDAKDRMELYRRAVTVRNVAIAKEERELEEKRRRDAAARQEERNGSGNGESNGSNGGYKKTMKKGLAKHRR